MNFAVFVVVTEPCGAGKITVFEIKGETLSQLVLSPTVGMLLAIKEPIHAVILPVLSCMMPLFIIFKEVVMVGGAIQMVVLLVELSSGCAKQVDMAKLAMMST